jgi:hypothetical protein
MWPCCRSSERAGCSWGGVHACGGLRIHVVGSACMHACICHAAAAPSVPPDDPGSPRRLPGLSCAGNGGAAPPGARRLTRRFDLSSHEGYVSYWAQLQYVVIGSDKQGKRLPPTDPLRQCFPFDRAPEVGGGGGSWGCPSPSRFPPLWVGLRRTALDVLSRKALLVPAGSLSAGQQGPKENHWLD